MAITPHWFLPTHGDGRSVVDRPHTSPVAAAVPREPDIDYLAIVAQAAERLGFTRILSPTLAAQMAATYQRVSDGRLLLNIVTGGDRVEQARFGDHLSHDQRYERT